jgi:REP element-mobilizing transposase RayT
MPVLAYHLIMSAYGFWLPNDPRGSWSDFVRAWELLRFGPATKVEHRRSVASKRHDSALRREAKNYLAHDPVRFTGAQARAIAMGFQRFVSRSGIIVLACAILPDHVHLVVLRHHYSIEEIARHLKGAATTELSRQGLHPFAREPYRSGRLPSPWARREWKCFIFDDPYLGSATRYVRRNPQREGLREQTWTFVTPWEGEGGRA